ncbi:nischarin-like [Hetaerina americana]|uniref:nischarin-like n=1 Tax=Hetaerina americana TaxID=62018 RepID=UPI003A7F4C2B
MACYMKNKHNTSIRIEQVELVDNYTLYHITVDVGTTSWIVAHRYSEFVDLNDKLISDYGVSKDLLPPKKVIGNKDPVFIEKRRLGLEEYLRTLLNFLQLTMPKELAVFLDFQFYDILFLLQNLAMKFFNDGDNILQKSRNYTFNPLELHAISERLKQPCPPLEITDRRQDFSHVLDFCSQLTDICIKGSNAPIKTSNIVPNSLKFELSAFKSVERLSIIGLPLDNIYDAQSLRQSVVSLDVHGCGVKRSSEILLCDTVHKNIAIDSTREALVWLKIMEVDFSNNDIEEIDDAVALMPHLQHLTMHGNKLPLLNNLTSLPHLSHLCLSANRFMSQNLMELHIQLGNIISIDLSENNINSLLPFSRLFSLEVLNVASNSVTDLAEVSHIAGLPCLESLVLTGNPLATVVDYRIRVLEKFGKRAEEICLDNERPTRKELDTVAVLQAIRIAREGPSRTSGIQSHTNTLLGSTQPTPDAVTSCSHSPH